MFCSECGAQVTDDAKFCESCGTPRTAFTERAPTASSGAIDDVADVSTGLRGIVGLGIVGAVLLAIALFVLLVVAGGGNTPEDVVRAFVTATQSKDVDEIIKQIRPDYADCSPAEKTELGQNLSDLPSDLEVQTITVPELRPGQTSVTAVVVSSGGGEVSTSSHRLVLLDGRWYIDQELC